MRRYLLVAQEEASLFIYSREVHLIFLEYVSYYKVLNKFGSFEDEHVCRSTYILNAVAVISASIFSSIYMIFAIAFLSDAASRTTTMTSQGKVVPALLLCLFLSGAMAIEHFWHIDACLISFTGYVMKRVSFTSSLFIYMFVYTSVLLLFHAICWLKDVVDQ